LFFGQLLNKKWNKKMKQIFNILFLPQISFKLKLQVQLQLKITMIQDRLEIKIGYKSLPK